MPIGRDEILNRFSSHPATPFSTARHTKIREGFICFAEFLDGVIPEGRAKDTAFINLQQAAMWANFGVAELVPIAKNSSETQTASIEE